VWTTGRSALTRLREGVSNVPYKDPKKQTKYQAHWVTTVRREWMEKQECELCGRRMNLRLFRHVGAPRLVWSKKGPSHNKFRVVCGDAVTCLQHQGEQRQGEQEVESKPKPKRKAVKRKRKAPEPEVPKPEMSRLAKQAQKPDVRPVCSGRHRDGRVHGPKGTVMLHGARRFICCGREVE